MTLYFLHSWLYLWSGVWLLALCTNSQAMPDYTPSVRVSVSVRHPAAIPLSPLNTQYYSQHLYHLLSLLALINKSIGIDGFLMWLSFRGFSLCIQTLHCAVYYYLNLKFHLINSAHVAIWKALWYEQEVHSVYIIYKIDVILNDVSLYHVDILSVMLAVQNKRDTEQIQYT